MAFEDRDSNLENGRPARTGGPAVIRNPTLPSENDAMSWWSLLPAGIVSLVVHAVLLSLFLLVNVSLGAKTAEAMETSVIETKVEDNPQDLNLTNDEIGIDPDVPTNYNVSRIEDVSVPGPVNPNESVGIAGAPEGPPTTLPPPPGLGGQGQGGGIDDPTKSGKANNQGFAGGMGGPKMIPGGFGGRSGSTREQMVREGGGNTRSEAAVAAGLKWMSQHQAPDGHWSLDNFSQHGKCNCADAGRQHDIAGTGFGLLPFLGAGETHKPTQGGRKQLYEKNVERGLKWLLLKQNRNGDFGGGMYTHGIASIAVCEAYGVTSDPMLKGPAQRAVNFIVEAQNDTGGWDYTAKGATADTSVSGWNVQALKSGQMGGLQVPKESLVKVNKYLDTYAGDPAGSSYGYRSPGAGHAVSAIGLLCREYLGWGPKNPGLIKGVDRLMASQPNQGQKVMYYYYYATQVVHHYGGQAWTTWNPKMRDMLIDLQDQGTDANRRHQKGSWSSANWDVGRMGGGRIMLTSMSLLTLEVYYRHLPLYRREQGGNKDLNVKEGL